MKNYFEHDIKVKFFDGLLELNSEWQWFVDEIEREFKGFKDVSNFEDFMSAFFDVRDVYSYLIKLRSTITELKLQFTKSWLEQIYFCAQIFMGSQNIDDIWQKFDNNFIRLFAIISYVTRLQNIPAGSSYIFSSSLFTQNNIFELIDLSLVRDEEAHILQLIASVQLDDKQDLITHFQNNVRGVLIPANLLLLEKFKEKFLSVNAFSFQRLAVPNGISWEEQFIFDMLQTKLSNGELVPFMTFNGVSTPDISRWSEDILEKLNGYFKSEIASFIVETVAYVLYKKIPSNKTIETHFNLTINDLKTKSDESTWNDIKSSSLLFLGLLLQDGKVPVRFKNKFMETWIKEISKFKDPETISRIKSHNIWISKEQKEVLEKYNDDLANRIADIDRLFELVDYFRNRYVADGITNDILKIIINKFTQLLTKADNSVEISALFYNFMQLLLNLLNNKNVDKSRVKHLMISLQQQWQNIYFNKCINAMHQIGGSVPVTNDEINEINEAFLNRTIRGALYCMPLKKENIVDLMAMHSQAVISLFCNTINITRTFPTENKKNLDRHEVDLAFVQLIREILNQKGYKLLNYVEPEILFGEIYDDFIKNTQFCMAIFDREKELYEKIKADLPEYSLIDYTGEVYLAHLTQLFPILENKIREFGAYCNIVPFKEKAKEFMHMKDASSVLQQILLDVYSETKDFLNVADLFVIYQSMYNGNGLNIRNECAHGREYISSGSLLFAFKTTLVSLKLILDRLNRIKTFELSKK